MKTINFLEQLKQLINTFYITRNIDALKECDNFINDCLITLIREEDPEYGTVEFDEYYNLQEKLNELDDLIAFYIEKIIEEE